MNKGTCALKAARMCLENIPITVFVKITERLYLN